MNGNLIFGFAIGGVIFALAVAVIWQAWLLDQYAKRVKELLPPF